VATDIFDPSAESALDSRRGGFGILLAAQSVIPVVVISVRFLLANETVGPVNQVLGILAALLGIAAAYAGLAARRAAARGDRAGYDQLLGLAALSTVATLVVMLVQWIVFYGTGTPPGSRYGEVFYVGTGTWLMYVVIAAFLLVAARARGRRVAYGPDDYWDVEAATLFTSFVALVGVVVYVIWYLI
jgi:heme/copper-type cytochrome/quinol oxidase subunit 3